MYILYLIFYLLYFLLVGASAVKFMRYMLPIYPFFAIVTSYALSNIIGRSDKFIGHVIKLSILLFAIIWTLMFINIYSQPNTRITATEWIRKNIPAGSTLAVEHWDDRLPIFGGEKYHFEELQLYNLPDDERKWLTISQQLQRADYIIIASNRLYVPLQKLTDCKKYKICFPKTAKYYKNLFASKPVIARSPPKADDEAISFKKVAEFSVYPQLSIGNYQLTINDDSADESFTVYDHPKVIIFKKI